MGKVIQFPERKRGDNRLVETQPESATRRSRSFSDFAAALTDLIDAGLITYEFAYQQIVRWFDEGERPTNEQTN